MHLSVDRARDLGPLFARNPHRMIGQDGAYSIPLRCGKTLWFFGDTLIGSRVPRECLWFPAGERLGPGDMSGHGTIEKLLTNSALLVTTGPGVKPLHDFCYVVDHSGQLKQLIPLELDESRDEIRVWCFHGYAAADRLYLFSQTVRMLADGPMPVNFEIIGSGLAVGSETDFDFVRLKSGASSIWWSADQPQFGCAVLHGDDEWLYVYGVVKSPEGVQQCYLARVREGEIIHRERYEYLVDNAPTWSPDIRVGRPIMAHMPNEMSVSWNDYLGCYLAVHSYDLSGRIVGRTARQPWGPWSEPADLWQVEKPVFDYPVPYEPLIYAGKEHPEMSQSGGKIIYLTYVEFEEYLPHLVEVVLA